MERKKVYLTAFVTAFTLMVTLFHYALLREEIPHVILEELYYLPLFMGALFFSLKGRVLVYVFVSVAYLPYFFGEWVSSTLVLVDRVLHLVFSGVFVFVAGFFIDRERKSQQELGKNLYLAGLGQVAAMIVHDLKNPLISILGFARRIREGKGDIGMATQVIEESARNMQSIVHGVLDFARPIRLEPKEEDLYHVLQEACEACKVKAEEREVVLVVNVPREPLSMEMDRLHFKRAFINLINNAIEASPKGQRVIIDIEREENHLLVKIKDMGSGMDGETLENVFIPFYSKKDKGTGLGMAIAKKIIEEHGGSIRLKSRLGLGTEVLIKLSSVRKDQLGIGRGNSVGIAFQPEKSKEDG